MILPNKITSFKESLISKTPYILDIIKETDATVLTIYEKTKEYFEDVNSFIWTIDVLYTLNKIELDDNTEVIRYVKNNWMW